MRGIARLPCKDCDLLETSEPVEGELAEEIETHHGECRKGKGERRLRGDMRSRGCRRRMKQQQHYQEDRDQQGDSSSEVRNPASESESFDVDQKDERE